RIHRRVDPQFGDGTLQNDGGVQMGKGGRRRGDGQIVRWDVHGLERRDRAFFGGRDALLQRAHFGGQGGLVADGTRGPAKQRGHLGPCLREAKDVVDEQEDVLVHLVSEV